MPKGVYPRLANKFYGRGFTRSPEDRAAYKRAYNSRPECRAKIKAYNRKAGLARRYGITEDFFRILLLGQGGSCAACKTSEWGQEGPCIDHDHKTGSIRGILCGKCNCAAGLLGDDPLKASQLANYLKKG